MNGFGFGRVRTVPERLTLVPATVAAWSGLKLFDPHFFIFLLFFCCLVSSEILWSWFFGRFCGYFSWFFFAAWSGLKLFDPDFATWVKGPELVFTRAIWITTVVLDEGLNIVRGAEEGHQHYVIKHCKLATLSRRQRPMLPGRRYRSMSPAGRQSLQFHNEYIKWWPSANNFQC